MSQDTGSSKAKKSRTLKTSKGKTPEKERIKCSLLLTRENDIRLTVLAAMKGMDRSSLINTFLDDCLRGVVVSLRGQLASDNGAGEGGIDQGEAEAA